MGQTYKNMKTLKESLLDDIDKTMKTGDKLQKTYQLAEDELKWAYKNICDFKSSMHDHNWYKGGSGRLAGNMHSWKMLLKTPRLSKFFNLKTKNLFVSVDFNNHDRIWRIYITNTGASKPVIDKQYQTMRTNSDKVTVSFTLKDTTVVDGKSQHTIEEIITNHLAPIFASMETFKEKFVTPSLECTSMFADTVQITI